MRVTWICGRIWSRNYVKKTWMMLLERTTQQWGGIDVYLQLTYLKRLKIQTRNKIMQQRPPLSGSSTSCQFRWLRGIMLIDGYHRCCARKEKWSFPPRCVTSRKKIIPSVWLKPELGGCAEDQVDYISFRSVRSSVVTQHLLPSVAYTGGVSSHIYLIRRSGHFQICSVILQREHAVQLAVGSRMLSSSCRRRKRLPKWGGKSCISSLALGLMLHKFRGPLSSWISRKYITYLELPQQSDLQRRLQWTLVTFHQLRQLLIDWKEKIWISKHCCVENSLLLLLLLRKEQPTHLYRLLFLIWYFSTRDTRVTTSPRQRAENINC